MEFQSRYQRQESDTSSVYVGTDPMVDIHNIRLRNSRVNSSPETPSQVSHLILGTTDDYQSNEQNIDHHVGSRHKHNLLQIILLIFTALSYLLYALRAHVPEEIQKAYRLLSAMKPTSIRRVYTPDLRPESTIENVLIRTAEACQTLWLIYILSYIPRRTNFGYLYRYPDIFNSLICVLLLVAFGLEAVSQTRLNQEISCACLFGSFIFLMSVCRLLAIKLVRYEEKMKSIDFIINRYFVLNCLFLYATTIAYSAICVTIEHYTFYLSTYVKVPTLPTTLGLLAAFILLVIYFIFDRLVYENEFWSIWTPYLFVGIVFICPPLRPYISSESHLITEGLNYYLLWALFITTVIMILIRIQRQISLKRNAMNKKKQNSSYKEQVTFQIES